VQCETERQLHRQRAVGGATWGGCLADPPAQGPSSDPRMKQGYAPRPHARATGPGAHRVAGRQPLVVQQLAQRVEGPQADVAPANRGLQRGAERRLARAAGPLRLGSAPRRALASRRRLRRPPWRRQAWSRSVWTGCAVSKSCATRPRPVTQGRPPGDTEHEPSYARGTERLPARVAAPTQPRAPAPTRMPHLLACHT